MRNIDNREKKETLMLLPIFVQHKLYMQGWINLAVHYYLMSLRFFNQIFAAEVKLPSGSSLIDWLIDLFKSIL